MVRLLMVALVALVSIVPAAASSQVLAALKGNDVLTLEVLATSAATADERALASGGALALRHKDADALAVLEPLAKGASEKKIGAAAFLTAGAVYLRQGRFAEVCRTTEAAQALGPVDHDELQTLAFARVLADAKPMGVAHRAAGSLVVTRDIAGLARVPVTVDGIAADAVIDSGAGFSSVSESEAKRLGITPLGRTATVTSASKDDVETRLGIAREMKFGDAVLTDVVFIILPDSALSFAGGKYKIGAIIGLPVFEALGRIELVHGETGESFRYGSKPDAPVLGNMILDGVEPVVLAEAGAAHLRLFIDTGATTTSLNGSAGRDFPALMTAAVKSTAQLQGAGGASDDPGIRSLPTLTLTIAGRRFGLSDVIVRSKIVSGHHGDIGQDVLKQGKRWSLDFEHMSFVVGD